MNAPSRLNSALLGADARLSASKARSLDLPERVLQFGEGNFLRAFVDWMIERMNSRGLFSGRAVLVQPIAQGLADRINEQDGLYTVLLRGVVGGTMVETRELVTAVSRCLDPYEDFDAVMELARAPELRFVVSNTTEAGIRVEADDRLDARPARSFPAKLTQLLFARFQHFDGDVSKGWVMLPCELIERNGDALKNAVLALAQQWALEPAFTTWIEWSCVFANTLVDRIVTGFPKDEVEELTRVLGYRDELMVAGEAFHCWVIESPRPLADELPLVEAGLDVIWTADMTPYRERKVRILNGAHTMLAVASFLGGNDTVRESMADPLLRNYVTHALQKEILPTLSLPRAEVAAFAESVIERFENPFIRHELLSIALNSVSKYKARLLCSVVDMHRRGQETPCLAFALAALLAFYRGKFAGEAFVGDRNGVPYIVKDDPRVLEFFQTAWAAVPGDDCSYRSVEELVEQALARDDFWGARLTDELPQLTSTVAEFLHDICRSGVRAVLEQLLEPG